MKKIFKVLAIVAVFVVIFAVDAFAQAQQGVFGVAREKVTNIFNNVRSIVYVLGGFGLVALAVAAIFGKPNWKWFAYLAIGIFVVAVAGSIIEYTSGTDSGLVNTIK